MMKNIFILSLLLGLALAGAVVADQPALRSTGAPKLDSLSRGEVELTIPHIGKEVQRVEFENGMVVFLYPDNRLPLISATAYIRCGSIYENTAQIGLSNLVGTVMRTGGSIKVSGDSLTTLLDFLGGSLEMSISQERGEASLNVLAKDLNLGLTLLADLLRHPAFPLDKLELAKVDTKNSIKRRFDDPNRVAAQYFARTLYPDHPYGRTTEWENIKGVTPEDLQAYHTRFFAPNHIVLGVSGDFNATKVLKQLKTLFGDWAKSIVTEAPIPPVVTEMHPGVYQIHKPINQAYLLIGHLGIKRDNPDRYALDLLNYVLGGGSFTSRLTGRVRSDEGLAYHVSSRFEIGSSDIGTFDVRCQTKSATAYKATHIITEELVKIAAEGVTEQELLDAKNSITNRLVFTFDTGGKIVRNLMALEYDGYPKDYYDTYFSNYRSVTLEDIKRVAATYLKPSQLTYIVVGDPTAFENSLAEFGTITDIEPQPPVLE